MTKRPTDRPQAAEKDQTIALLKTKFKVPASQAVSIANAGTRQDIIDASINYAKRLPRRK